MPDDAYARALRLLGQRAHLRAELRRKLLHRGFDADEVESALDRVAAAGHLDDARTAQALAEEGQARRGWGKARVKAELVRRGAGGAAIDAALAGTSDEEEIARARELATRWRRTNRSVGPDASAKLARHLDRKGFSRRAIFAALSEAGAATELDLESLDGPATDPAD
jgi:regulatory protein